MVKKNAFNTVTTFSKITALVMFIMFPVVTFYLGVMYQERLDKPFMQQYVEAIKPIQKACTMEAKLCPDGSYVGRSGSNCEFDKCPAN